MRIVSLLLYYAQVPREWSRSSKASSVVDRVVVRLPLRDLDDGFDGLGDSWTADWKLVFKHRRAHGFRYGAIEVVKLDVERGASE